jgi:hypothetical protein
VDTGGKTKKRTSKKNVNGRCTSSHGNKTFRSRSVVKQKEMVFGFHKIEKIDISNYLGKAASVV